MYSKIGSSESAFELTRVILFSGMSQPPIPLAQSDTV